MAAPTHAAASSPGLLFRQRVLPDPAAAANWEHIIIPERMRQMLFNYARLAMSADAIDPVVGGMYRFIILRGEPGTGKSSFALGLANVVATTLLPARTSFWQLNAEAFFSEWEGRTPRLIHEGFDLIRLAAERAPVVVLIDELEALAFERRRLLNSSDPSDLTRGVDTLLRELDDLRTCPQLLVIGTTNFPEAVDRAVLDRSDLPQVHFPLPAHAARAAILADTFAAYQPQGLRLDQGDAQLLADGCDGISGRQLRKCVWLAQVMTDRSLDRLNRADLSAAITELMSASTGTQWDGVAPDEAVSPGPVTICGSGVIARATEPQAVETVQPAARSRSGWRPGFAGRGRAGKRAGGNTTEGREVQ